MLIVDMVRVLLRAIPSLSSCGWPITQEVSHFPAAVGEMVVVVGLTVVAGMARVKWLLLVQMTVMSDVATHPTSIACDISSTGISTSPILE